MGETVLIVVHKDGDENSRKPKQMLLTSEHQNNETLYIMTDVEVITKFEIRGRCHESLRAKRGDEITLSLEAFLGSAKLKLREHPGMYSLLTCNFSIWIIHFLIDILYNILYIVFTILHYQSTTHSSSIGDFVWGKAVDEGYHAKCWK